MTKYRFDQIAENIRVPIMPKPEDSAKYIGLEHLDTDSLRVRRWGTDIALIGQKLEMKEGDVLFARRNAYLRRVAVAPFDGVFSAHGMVLRAKTDVCLHEFLPVFMQSDYFMERAIKISVGSLSPTINWSALAREEFEIPPLDEQRRIANLLNQFSDTLDALANFVLRAQDLETAIVNDRIPFPTWTDGKYELNEDMIQAGWKMNRVSEFADVVRGSSPRPKGDPRYYNGSIPRLMVEDITRDGMYVTPKVDTLTEEGAKLSRPVPAGTLVMVCSGNAGIPSATT